MSWRQVDLVLRLEVALTPAARLILIHLAWHAHDDGTRAYPGVPRLAHKVSKSERQIQRLLRTLEAMKLITATGHIGGGRGHATEYRLNLGNGVAAVASSGKKGDDHVTLSGQKWVTPVTERMTSVTFKDDTGVAPTGHEPVKEPVRGDARVPPQGQDDGLVLVEAALRRLGITPPRRTKRQADAARELVAAGYPIEEIAACWHDIASGEYGDGLDQRILSFTYLSDHSRIDNWRRWRDNGRAPQGRQPNGHDRKAPVPAARRSELEGI